MILYNGMEKSRVIKFLRRILLASIVAVAILSIGWFVYAHFFQVTEAPYFNPTTRAGVANTIRQNSQPVSTETRLQVLNMITKNTTPPVPDKNGEIQNTTPEAEREATLRRMFGN